MMKKSKNKKVLVLSMLLVILFGSCSEDVLQEQPRSIFTPEFFQTEQGVEGGITSLYERLRYIYGNGYYYAGVQSGTDESTYGANVNNDSKNADLSGVGNLSSTQNPYGAIWSVFPSINTANGIIENAEEVGTISDELVAEARFFRGFYYSLLVKNFGGVPLDLGAGELQFNRSTARTSVRNTVPEVYTKAIFPDLIRAVEDLPETSRLTGTANKTLARLTLSKAYLTYAWWLENPKNIPTYPETTRTDPDGHDAQYYYQKAYDVAVDGIELSPGSVGLLEYYYDVHSGENERNKEWLLYADHTEFSSLFNGAAVNGWGSGGSPGNFAPWFATWNYTEIRSSEDPSEWQPVVTVGREAVQKYGRPWTGVATTQETIINTFANKSTDSRYDGTFTTIYRGNWNRNNISSDVLYNANFLPITMEDPALTFLDNNPGNISYPEGGGLSNVGGGIIPDRADWVVAPQGISRYMYPGLWKLGPHRTDNGQTLGQANVTYTRPFPVAKFSELYFVAAEAAVKGANTEAGKTARELINVIRGRAGKWRYSNNQQEEKIEDYSDELIANTPAVITIDYILDERTREYYGEGIRWYDLTRTQKWEERARTYTIAGSDKGDHTPMTINRDIQPFHYLRPIPQGQLDGMEMTEAEKAAYQNPGYN
ncbi:RagB/SusD family nutrient uptake outer membrane protein [Autumnicola psychrophila]|uniref:RagB/SusD family nutrient uptake outer membrane protein n=1 Tax=Autumnicola psychrophila TaxID=3075592 RepID=A0ABU3DVU0_9FLAO|nr:RagB/SusD family nutrient uptake outer membrane protein [Zunongwangia sp. F225]MDT0687845.1 RagB/SusD family nutrient uptake outer membrane protein [Zunongwangia sp. F225]